MKAEKVISVLLAMTLALVGVTYQSLTTRLDAQERKAQTAEQVARDAAETARLVRDRLETLIKSVDVIAARLDSIDDAMRRNDVAREILLTRTASLLSTMTSNRQDYKKSLDEWNDANAAQRKRVK